MRNFARHSPIIKTLYKPPCWFKAKVYGPFRGRSRFRRLLKNWCMGPLANPSAFPPASLGTRLGTGARGSASAAQSAPPFRAATALRSRALRAAGREGADKWRFATTCLRKKPFVDPISRVVIKVLHCVRILSRIRFTRDAGRLRVCSAFYNHKILIAAPRKLIMNLIVPDKIMRSHRGHQERRPDRWQMTGRSVIAGTMVNSIHRIGCPNRPRA